MSVNVLADEKETASSNPTAACAPHLTLYSAKDILKLLSDLAEQQADHIAIFVLSILIDVSIVISPLRFPAL